MWRRTKDDSVLDDAGKVIYFSLERFVRDIALGDCCFVCGASPADVPFNNEHVIPEWILRRFALFDRFLTLPNGASTRYDRYTVPCCVACNDLMGRAIEQPTSALTEGGYDAVQAWCEQHRLLNLYVWVGLLFLKTHLKDRLLRAHLDARKGDAPIAEELRYDWRGLHYLHTLVRCFANRSAKRYQSSERIIILDCCHAGAADELFGAGGIPLNEGVAVLAACRRDQNAFEIGGRGTFSRLVGDALDGGAADVRGFVTASAVYSYIDEVMAVDEQRPLFKTNVAKFEPLRRAAPSVNDEELRRIAVYFPTPDHIYPLGPSYEPTEEPRNPEHEAIFGDLQDFRSARLVVPLDEKHLYYAALNSKACALTALGRSYWYKIKAGRM